MHTILNVLIEYTGSQSASSPLAYLDPGAGSMLLQVLVAGLFSSMFFVKSSYSYVREAVLAKKRKS